MKKKKKGYTSFYHKQFISTFHILLSSPNVELSMLLVIESIIEDDLFNSSVRINSKNWPYVIRGTCCAVSTSTSMSMSMSPFGDPSAHAVSPFNDLISRIIWNAQNTYVVGTYDKWTKVHIGAPPLVYELRSSHYVASPPPRRFRLDETK